VLTADLPEENLRAGDIGAVIHIHNGGEGYEVEFITLDGETVAIASLRPGQLRPIAHVRTLQTA